MSKELKFQRMWEAGAIGTMAGETIAFNFSSKNTYKKH